MDKSDIAQELDQLRSTVAGLRRALEEIANDGVERSRDPRTLIAQSALTASPDEHERRIKSEALREAAEQCQEVMPDDLPHLTYNQLMEMANELEAQHGQ